MTEEIDIDTARINNAAVMTRTQLACGRNWLLDDQLATGFGKEADQHSQPGSRVMPN
jgi:hypothetical protein